MSLTKEITRLVPFEELSKEEQRLLRAARKTMKRAYNPYSGFYVGAAVLTTRNEIVTGANFETAAYGDSICAERTALVRANAMGYGNRCKTIAVITKNRNLPTTEISAPCGSCRQMIYEVAQRSGVGEDFKIILSTTRFDKIVVTTIGELLPLAFGPKDLGIVTNFSTN
jgi:cytidine deaminase